MKQVEKNTCAEKYYEANHFLLFSSKKTESKEYMPPETD
jgi:hypothetical protein